MKNTFTPLFFLLTATLCGHSQTTITIQPDSSGEDAMLVSLYPSSPDGGEAELNAMAWTNQGAPANLRGLLGFDLTAIPANATIQSAYLTLYFNPTSLNGSGHSHQSGSNASLLQRVTEPWNELTATWDNQPATTTQNEVILPQDTFPQQDYKADVTALILDMINNPVSSYGFLLKLQTEEHYRSLLFCSGDYPDKDKHPKLEVTYAALTGIADITVQNDFIIYQNPAADFLDVKIAGEIKGKISFQIYDALGRTLLPAFFTDGNVTLERINISSLNKGIYFLRIKWGNSDEMKKFVKQ